MGSKSRGSPGDATFLLMLRAHYGLDDPFFSLYFFPLTALGFFHLGS